MAHSPRKIHFFIRIPQKPCLDNLQGRAYSMRETAAGRLLLCGLRAIIQVYRGVSIKEYYGERKNQSVADLVPRGIYGGTDRLHYVLSFATHWKNGAQSSARSQAVMQLVNSALAKVHLGPLSEHLIRKLAHFFGVCAGRLSADALRPRVHKVFLCAT